MTDPIQTMIDNVAAREEETGQRESPDAAYDRLVPASVQPHTFRVRYMTETLSEEEQDACEGCTDAEAAFAAVYPGYVSRGEFREALIASRRDVRNWTANPEGDYAKPPTDPPSEPVEVSETD